MIVFMDYFTDFEYEIKNSEDKNYDIVVDIMCD